MWEAINSFLTTVDNLVWGVPLMVLIMAGGILLTARLGLLQMRRLPLALKWMFKNEEEGDGEISSFAAPVYFYGISAQMKTFIDRTYPIWQHLGKKEVYYIISAGLGEDIIERPLGDLDGFVEHLEEYKIAGKIYAANVMDAGLVRNQSVFKKAYDMGYSVQNAEKLRVGE